MDERAPGPPQRLKKRADFQRAAKGLRASASSLTVQAAPGAGDAVRVGFTTTKKLGCAVIRNRVRRKLRAAAAAIPAIAWEAGNDYVVIARAEALRRPFADLLGDVAGALRRVAKERRRRATDTKGS